MPSEETAYRYTIPLEETGGVERPAYSSSDGQDTLDVTIEPEHKVLVTEEGVPHLHKDSVNVQVSEVPLEDFVDETDNQGES